MWKKPLLRINYKGITLLETLISLAVFSISFVGIISLIGFAKKNIKHGMNKEFVTLEAKNLLENVSFYEELKSIDKHNLNDCINKKNSLDQIILNKVNYCQRFRNKFGVSQSNQINELEVSKYDEKARIAKIKIQNKTTKNLYVYSKIFTPK